MFRAVPRRFAGVALVPIAAVISLVVSVPLAECGGNDVVDSIDARSADSALEAARETGVADGQSEAALRDAPVGDAVVPLRDAEAGLPDALDLDVEVGLPDALDLDVEVGLPDALDLDVEVGLPDALDAADAGDGEGGLAAPLLRTASRFALLAGAAITSTGATSIVGDVGIWPSVVPPVGLTPGQVTGTIVTSGGPVAAQGEADLMTAYADAQGRPCEHTMTSVDLGGKTLPPGVYCFAGAAVQMAGNLVLDGQGDPNAVWIFQISSTLTISTNVSTTMINGGNACNVYWQVGSSATINGGAQFMGNILAQASISLLTGASVSPGRALAQTAAVTMDTNAISKFGCP
jgi:Ice-binding-like